MILLMESRDARYVRDHGWSQTQHRSVEFRLTNLERSEPPRLLKIQEEQIVTFDPCAMWVHYPVQEEVVRFGDMPAAALVGWRLVCRPKWSVTGRMIGAVERPPTEQDLSIQQRVDATLCVFIVIQWLLVGGLPLVGTRKPWREPGAFITSCTLIAAAIAMIHAIDGLARLPALLAGLAWFWWLLLLIWKGVCLAWRSVVELRTRPAAI